MDVTERHGALAPEQIPAVAALAGRATAQDGVAPLGEATLLALTGGSPDPVHLLVDGGYCQVDLTVTPPSGEIVVDPALRRGGRGRALLRAAQDLAPDVRVWAHGDLPGARALARSAGLVPVRRLAVLARPVTAADAPLPEPPPGVELTAFRPGRDEAAWVTANAAAFAAHPEQGRLTEADLARRTAQDWFDPADLVLAWRGAELLGSVWVKVEDPASGDGELYVLGVVPAAQGLGLGGVLTRAALARVAAHGLRRCLLYVDPGDARAMATYTAAGFTPIESHVQYARP